MTEQELFEQWAKPDAIQQMKTSDGHYLDRGMASAFAGWKARAKLAEASLPAAEDARDARYRQIIEQLWNIVDDIDTASDMFKSDDAAYREYVEAKQRCRWGTGITTDGYSLNIDAAMQDSKEN